MLLDLGVHVDVGVGRGGDFGVDLVLPAALPVVRLLLLTESATARSRAVEALLVLVVAGRRHNVSHTCKILDKNANSKRCSRQLKD
jgi:hypothetical protein